MDIALSLQYDGGATAYKIVDEACFVRTACNDRYVDDFHLKNDLFTKCHKIRVYYDCRQSELYVLFTMKDVIVNSQFFNHFTEISFAQQSVIKMPYNCKNFKFRGVDYYNPFVSISYDDVYGCYFIITKLNTPAHNSLVNVILYKCNMRNVTNVVTCDRCPIPKPIINKIIYDKTLNPTTFALNKTIEQYKNKALQNIPPSPSLSVNTNKKGQYEINDENSQKQPSYMTLETYCRIMKPLIDDEK